MTDFNKYNPIGVALSVLDNQIVFEKVFKWWVYKLLNHFKCLIGKVKRNVTWYNCVGFKYGILLP